MITRRAMVAGSALAFAGSRPFLHAASAAEKPPLPPGLPEGVYETATLEALPGKKPLIKLSYRPPNYETPLSHSPPNSRQTTPSSCATTSRQFRKRSTRRDGSSKWAAKVSASRWS